MDKYELKTVQSDRKPLRWFERLHVRFSLIQICLLVVVIAVSITVVVMIERALLLKQGYELSEQLGNRVVAELRQRITRAETLVATLANLGEVLNKDADTFMKIVPHMVNYEGEESFIAGGGLWPEPGAFEPGVERRSFFWGRDEQGVLQYFDDYNDPAGAGYHHEEWYVPATFYPAGQAFWSKSYMDPYSYQPMVTCTVPMRIDGKITGVATVDLKLEGLEKFFEDAAGVVGGYIFAVDRNNKLLSYPNPAMAKLRSVDDKGNVTEEYLTVRELARKIPVYQTVADELDGINASMISIAQKKKGFDEHLPSKLDEGSYQINPQEALLTTAIMGDPFAEITGANETMEMKRMFLASDPLLKTPVMAAIFHVPGTYWKLVFVTPQSTFLAVADHVTKEVAFYIVGLELLALVIVFIAMQRMFIVPLRRMASDVREKSLSGGLSADFKLNESSRNELGDLAHEFNNRTNQLLLALEHIDKTNEMLEETVKQRTKELEAAQSHLIQSEKMASIGNLAAGVAHEINNPIGFIASNINTLKEYISVYGKFSAAVDKLKKDVLPFNIKEVSLAVENLEKIQKDLNFDFVNDDIQKLVEESIGGVQRIARIVNDLKNFSRVHEDERNEVFVEDIVEGILGIALNQIRFKADVVKQYGRCSRVTCNEQSLGQVFLNLIINAAQAIVEKGEIIIKTYEQGGFVCVDIQDNGQGIPQENLRNIFNPFFTTKPVGQGTGLGLSISYEIIQKHGGDISVVSEVGKGTTFTVKLPVSKE